MKLNGLTFYELTLIRMGVQMTITNFKNQNEFFKRQGHDDKFTEEMYNEFSKLSEKLQLIQNDML